MHPQGYRAGYHAGLQHTRQVSLSTPSRPSSTNAEASVQQAAAQQLARISQISDVLQAEAWLVLVVLLAACCFLVFKALALVHCFFVSGDERRLARCGPSRPEETRTGAFDVRVWGG